MRNECCECQILIFDLKRWTDILASTKSSFLTNVFFCLGLIKLSFTQRKDTFHVIYERELLQV